MVAPAAPAVVDAQPPLPRVVWAARALRLIAHDWADGHEPTYSVLARHGKHWEPASGEETVRCLFALAAWLDEAPNNSSGRREPE